MISSGVLCVSIIFHKQEYPVFILQKYMTFTVKDDLILVQFIVTIRQLTWYLVSQMLYYVVGCK
jgi:hypothetical protein